MKKIFVTLGLSLMVVGCATAYQPKSYTGGFEDINLGQGKHEITFFGNGYSKKNQLQYYNKKRSAELCPNGFNLLNEDYTVPEGWGPLPADGWKTLVTTIECKN